VLQPRSRRRSRPGLDSRRGRSYGAALAVRGASSASASKFTDAMVCDTSFRTSTNAEKVGNKGELLR